MPKGEVKKLFGVFDANSIYVLASLAECEKTFSTLQRDTKIPKASLHKILSQLHENGMLMKVEEIYSIANNGRIVLEAYSKISANRRSMTLEEIDQRKKLTMPIIFSLPLKKQARTRPRDLGEAKILAILVNNSWDKMIREGKIRRINQLTYEMKI